jgi:DNA-binding MarR family transcriptional regulator
MRDAFEDCPNRQGRGLLFIMLYVTTIIMKRIKAPYGDKAKYDRCIKDIGVLLQRSSHVFQMMEREQRRKNGFTGSQSFLLTLILEEGEMTMGEIGERMNLEKSTVTRLYTPLKRDNLIESTVSKSDKRVIYVKLTERGYLTAKAVKESREEYYGQLISLLPRGHVREIMSSAEVLTRALEKIDF